MLISIYMQILDMTKIASLVIVVILLARLLLKRLPKVVSYALWAVVLFRLLCPLSIEVPVSIMPEITPTEASYTLADVPITPASAVEAAYEAMGDALNGGLGIQHIRTELPAEEGANVSVVTAAWWEVWILFGQYVWLAGILGMAVYAAVSYAGLRRKLLTASPLRDNIYLADDITSPFVMGLFKPRIYLPSAIDEREQSYIILHEQHHIRRFDHVIKALAFVALSIHWFNPLVWVAFIMAGKDMEMSCDEAVVKKMGDGVLADYTASLLSLATGRHIIAGMPLAFGEGDTKGRIRNLAKWRKPAIWVLLTAVIGCSVLAVTLLTNPAKIVIDPSEVESVTVDGTAVSGVRQNELIDLLNRHRKTPFPVGADDPNSLSVAVEISCADGSFYLLHYQYYSGFSFSPKHPGEDDYRSILTQWGADGKAVGAWKLEYEFDSAFSKWYRNESAFGTGSYGVVEATYQSPHFSFAMVPGDNTPFYKISSDMELSSCGEHSSDGAWLTLGIMTETTLTKENFDKLFTSNSGEGWALRQSAAAIRKDTVKAWMLVYNQEILYCLLQQENGELYLAYGYYDHSEKDDTYSDDTSIRWLFKLAKDETDVAIGTNLTELIPGTAYVSYQCIYLNPLSSYAAFGGDSGCIYTVGEDCFETYNRTYGTQNVIEVTDWEWKPFPYTEEEWLALYQPTGFYALNIHALFDKLEYLPLNAGKFFMRADGDIWLVDLSSGKSGACLWSIYSLVPESVLGTAKWEYASILSSRSPVFQFKFDMEYTEISASCITGQLVEFNFGDRESGSTLIFPAEEPLSWSPAEGDHTTAENAAIHFSIHNGDTLLCSGTIYIEASDGEHTGRTVYKASLVGTGLSLSPDPEGEGGIISLQG